MRYFKIYAIILSLLVSFLVNGDISPSSSELPGFSKGSYHDEQIITYKAYPDIRIHINAPSSENFDPTKPVGLALFALPNGNTIEQTVGKVLNEGDDWHYDIQHIGAQTRFLRNEISDKYNLVTVYLEAKQKSWPSWKSQHAEDYKEIIKSIVNNLLSYFNEYDPFVILTGHSGGGRFTRPSSFLELKLSIPYMLHRCS
jgi:hypothetical protein